LKATVIVVFSIGLLLSARLWIGPRSYPLTPVWSALPAADGIVGQALFVALFVLAITILISPKPQKFIAAFLVIIAVFCLLDQTRWQPWVFQYSFLLATLALFSWDCADVEGQKRTLNVAQLIISATYIFSGLQKINLNFMLNDFTWLVQPITSVLPSTADVLHYFGMAAPFVQIAFGAGLLTKRFRHVSLVLAVSMHIFILAMFGPTGHNWNNIIWPWTAVMAAFDILLFAGNTEFSLREIIWTRRSIYHAATFLLFALLPALSFFNLWDSYLSAALYSGNLTEAQIYTSDAGRDSLSEPVKSRLVHTSADTNVINIQRWAIEDINVTSYPETRVYKSIAKSVCNQMRDPTQLVLIVQEQRMFFSKPETGYRCWEL
jgi:hypothetical protein